MWTKLVCTDGLGKSCFLLKMEDQTLHKIEHQPALETKANWCVNSKRDLGVKLVKI